MADDKKNLDIKVRATTELVRLKADIQDNKKEVLSLSRELSALKASGTATGTAIKDLENKLQSAGAKLYQNTTELKKNNDILKQFRGENSLSAGQVLNFAKNLTVVTAGLYAVTTGLFNFGREAITSSTKFKQLRAEFKGSEEDIELFRKATGRTVGTGDLLKLSNQAEDLGVTLDKQPIFFLAAKKAAERYGTDVAEGFTKVVNATEGMEKGLKALGIQKARYKAILEDLIIKHGGELEVMQANNGEIEYNIKNLDAQTQKTLRVDAVIKALGLTIEDVNNRMQTDADKIEQLNLLAPQLKKQFGDLVAPAIIKLTDNLKAADGSFNKTTVSIAGTAFAITQIIPFIGSLRLAFAGLQASMGWIGVIGLAVSGLIYLFSKLSEDSVKDVSEIVNSFKKENDEIAKTKNNLKQLEALQKESSLTTVRSKEAQEAYEKQLEDTAKIYPQIISGVDGYTGKIIVNNDVLEKVIESERELLKLRLEAQQAQIILDIQKINEEHEKEINKIEDLKKSIQDESSLLAIKQKQLQDTQKAYEEYQKVMDKDNQGTRTKNLREYINNIAALKNEVDGLRSSVSSNGKELTANSQQLILLKQKYIEMIQAGLKIGDIATLSKNLIALLSTNKKGVQELTQALNTLGPAGSFAMLGFEKALAGSSAALSTWTILYVSWVKAINEGNAELAVGIANQMSFVMGVFSSINSGIKKPTENLDKKPPKEKKEKKEKDDEQLTLEKFLGMLRTQVDLFEQSNGKQGWAYQIAIKELEAKKNLIEVTKDKISAEEKSNEIAKNTAEYLKTHADLENKIAERVISNNNEQIQNLRYRSELINLSDKEFRNRIDINAYDAIEKVLLKEMDAYYQKQIEAIEDIKLQNKYLQLQVDIRKRINEIDQEFNQIELIQYDQIANDIASKRIELIKEEFKRRNAEIEHSYELELQRISLLKDATPEQREELKKLAYNKKNLEQDKNKQALFQTILEGMQDFGGKVGNIFSSLISTFHLDANSALGDIANKFNTIVSISQIILEIFEAIKKAQQIGSFIDTILGFLPGGGAISVAGGAASGGGRASGGPVKRGFSYIVGEKGPELFIPAHSGNIVNNDRYNDIMNTISSQRATQPTKVIYVPVPTLPTVMGKDIQLSYDRTNEYYKKIKT